MFRDILLVDHSSMKACGFEMLYQEDKARSQFSKHGDTEIATSFVNIIISLFHFRLNDC